MNKGEIKLITPDGEVRRVKEVEIKSDKQETEVSAIDQQPDSVIYSFSTKKSDAAPKKIQITRNGIRNLFPFLDEKYSIDPSFYDEIKEIKEKCEAHPTQVQCDECFQNSHEICWNLILGKIFGISPHVHGGYEVADTTVFKHDGSTYFVIKKGNITKPASKEGNKLFRQCVSLFGNENVHIIYLNASTTSPDLIQDIKIQASNNKYSPRFSVLQPNEIEQICAYYLNLTKKNRE